MAHFLNSHGIELVISFYIYSSIVSTMPALPDDASYLAKWAYGFLHMSAANWKQAMKSVEPFAPVEPNSVTVKTEVKQTTVENKTEEKQ